MNDASILAPIKKRKSLNVYNEFALPKIPEGKFGGKRRTKKNKSNRRKTIRKK
jgi:hypothetical protein